MFSKWLDKRKERIERRCKRKEYCTQKRRAKDRTEWSKLKGSEIHHCVLLIGDPVSDQCHTKRRTSVKWPRPIVRQVGHKTLTCNLCDTVVWRWVIVLVLLCVCVSLCLSVAAEAVWRHLCGPEEPFVRWGPYWRHLANTIDCGVWCAAVWRWVIVGSMWSVQSATAVIQSIDSTSVISALSLTASQVLHHRSSLSCFGYGDWA